MQLNGYIPDTIVYNFLLDGLFKVVKVNDGCQLFEKMVQNGEALELVEEIERRGFIVDLVTISSLVIGLYKEGQWDWTDKLMKHNRDDNLVPSVLKWKVDMEGFAETMMLLGSPYGN
ncbi:hypothetical protein ACFX2F_019715 [Malus domestica]